MNDQVDRQSFHLFYLRYRADEWDLTNGNSRIGASSSVTEKACGGLVPAHQKYDKPGRSSPLTRTDDVMLSSLAGEIEKVQSFLSVHRLTTVAKIVNDAEQDGKSARSNRHMTDADDY